MVGLLDKFKWYWSGITEWWSFLVSRLDIRAWKKLEFQHVLVVSNSHIILLALGHFLLILVNGFGTAGWLAWTVAHWASKLEKLLAQQENLLVPDYWMGIFSSPDLSLRIKLLEWERGQELEEVPDWCLGCLTN